MDDEAMKQLDRAIAASVNKAVNRTVNGKIDGIKALVEQHNAKHEKDMEEIKPVIQFVAGTRMLGEIVKWLASVAVAYLALKGFFSGIFNK